MITAVTGASGHFGGNLVRALLERGRRVRCLLRGDRRAVEGLPVQVVEGDLGSRQALARLLEGADTLFHAAARISIVDGEEELLERTNVAGVRGVVDACLAAGVRRLVHVSSIHAFRSHPNDRPLEESRELALGAEEMAYDRSKARGQLEVLEGVRRGLSAVIVNPTALVGPRDFKPSRMGEVFLDLYHHRLPLLLDGGFNWVDVRDAVEGAIAAEQRGRAGECYLLGGHWVHLREVSALIGRLTGRRTPRAAAPLWLALAASRVVQAYGRLRGRTPKFTPAAVRSVSMHHQVSHAKAARELGYRPRPFEDTVRDTLAWFAAAGILEEPYPEPVEPAPSAS